MNLFPTLPKTWITSSLTPEQIRAQAVWIELKDGQKKREQFEIEEVNRKGQMLVRIDYSSGAPGQISLASYRVTQRDIDAWVANKEVVLKV